MNNIVVGSCFVLAANLIAAISQLLLKLAARRVYPIWWRSYVNPYVITAYGMFFATTFLNIIALRHIPLTLSAALASSGQIFVPALSAVFLKERISRRRLIGMLVIVIGIVLFSL